MSSGTARLRDAIGFFVLLIAGLAAPARAALSTAKVFNNNAYLQNSTAAPTSPQFSFLSLIGTFPLAAGYDSVVCQYPGPASVNVPLVSSTEFLSQPLFPTQTDLHNQYSFGNYTYTATNSITHATAQGSVAYTLDAFPAAIPALTSSSYTLLQTMHADQSFAVNFNGFILNPNTTLGGESLSIEDVANNYSSVFSGSGLVPTTTSYVLPANTLAPARQYRMILAFSDRINGVDSATGVSTELSFQQRTQIFFTTASVPEPGTLGVLGVAGGLMLQRKRRRGPRGGR